MAASIPQIVVHLVHGTWPYGRGKKPPDPDRSWFRAGSTFCEGIENHAGIPIEFVTFKWSGDNSFVARNKAATELYDHLQECRKKRPDARHLILAHSHGGTVAVAAAGNPNRPLKPPLAGVLTMATPFVTLRENVAGVAGQAVRAAVLRWGMATLLCTVLAAAGAWVIGGGGWLSTTVTLFFAFMSILIFITSVSGVGWVMPNDTQGLHALIAPFSPAPSLACPLIAYRAPGDEASLAISAAQFLDWSFNQIWYLLIVYPLEWWERLIERWGPRRTTLGIWAALALLILMYDLVFTGDLRPFWVYPIAGVFYAGVWMVVIAMVLVTLVPLILLPGLIALRAATGPEVFRYAGYATVDADPLPAGTSAEMVMFTLTDDERRTMLRHSIHALPQVQQRIGKWIRELYKPARTGNLE